MESKIARRAAPLEGNDCRLRICVSSCWSALVRADSGRPRQVGLRTQTVEDLYEVAALAGADEQAAIRRPPVLDQQAQQFIRTEPRIGQRQEERSVSGPFEGVSAKEKRLKPTS